MGLNLLGVFTIKLPGFCGVAFKGRGVVGSYLVGLLFGLVASPCATPVLVVIVAYVASKGQVLYGGSLLFTYGLGHGLPLLLAGTFTSFLKSLPAFRKFSRYINLASGVILIGIGMYFLYLWGQTSSLVLSR
jgi:cytochrome c-type biogenesis protein